MLCCASLQLRAFYFFERPHHRQRGLLKSYSTAISLINKTEEATRNSDFMIYAPAYFGHMILTAGIIVLKILHSSFSSFVEFAEGKRAYNSVVTLLRRASIEDSDLHGKSSKILAQLWAIHDPSTSKLGNEEDPSLRLKTRSSASVMHDALWVWRERFAKQYNSQRSGAPLTPAPPAPTTKAAEVPTTITSPNEISRSHATTEGLHLVDESNPSLSTEGIGVLWDLNLPWMLPMDLDAYLSWEDQQSDLARFQYPLEADARP